MRVLAPRRATGPLLQAIGCSAVPRTHVSDLQAHEPSERLDTVIADGWGSFIRRDCSVAVLAAEAIQETLSAGGIEADAIDAVVIGTESLWETGSGGRRGPEALRECLFRTALVPAGLSHASVYGVWMAGCCNLSSCLSLARSLVVARQHARVLVVLADRHLPQASRIIGDGLGLFSDMAVAFLVTGGDGPGYRIAHVVSLQNLPLDGQDSKNRFLIAQRVRKAARQFGARIREMTGAPLASYPIVLPDHVHTALVRLVCDALDVPATQVRLPAKEDFAHGFSADTIVALARLTDTHRVEAGDRIALLNIGPWSLGVALLERE